MTRSYIPVLQTFNAHSEKDWHADVLRFMYASHAAAITKTAAFTADVQTFFYPANATSGAFAVTLPPAGSLQGKPYAIKNTGTANNVTLTPAAGDTIDGFATVAIAPGMTVYVVSDGIVTWMQILAGAGSVSSGVVEGTFTPAFGGTGGDPSVTYTQQLGRYTKISRLVTFHVYVGINAIAVAGVGSLRIKGLPFQIGSTEAEAGGGFFTYAAGLGATTSPASLFGVPGTTQIGMFRRAGADARAPLTTVMVATDLTTTTDIEFSGHYYTD